MIPKKIFTIWLNDNSPPKNLARYIKTHHIPGYEHVMITLDNCHRNEYVDTSLSLKKWVKAVNFLRVWYLYEHGGIYLDADMEILPDKNFDAFLSHEIFVCREKNGFLSNAIIGARRGHPLLRKYLERVLSEFSGDDGLTFQPGMELWTHTLYESGDKTVKIYPDEYFIPYDHQSGVINITDNTITYHYFSKSWIND